MAIPESALELARQQIVAARDYSLSLLADVEDPQWYVRPAGCPSHIAWQVGHLAMAQYFLTLMRIRGRQPEDEALIDKDFLRLFQKGSEPDPDPTVYPSVSELRSVLDRVHQRCLEELPGFGGALLEEPLPAPYFGYPNKLGSLLFCAAHEMLHAGQIGLIRRQLGKNPLR
ncbi:MAG: hypothetical protein KatS3mg110_2184 [Pirellulaceae bacterium]|nr:MAG: hypothetical protein KatS3mg110_2184 [Pirellulaceae bacterium]